MAPYNNDPEHSTDAIALLKADHRQVKSLFRRYEAATDPYTRGMIAEKAFTELEIHSQLEEQVFYPAFEQAADEEWQPVVTESMARHQAVRDLIDVLQAIDPAEPDFHIMFQELMNSVEDHMTEEETEMFFAAEAVLAEHMADLLDEMQELKRNLLSS